MKLKTYMRIFFISSVISLLVLSGCSDPFGLTKKKLSEKYYIHEFDEALPATYYVIEKGVDSGGGVFDGVIQKIGWKHDELLADVKRLSSGDVSGWYKLNLKTGVITGPITNTREITSFKAVKVQDFYQNPEKYKIK